MSEIVPSNVQSLLDKWMEAERNGDRFPVPLDEACLMAGYSRKDNAKRALPKSSQGELFRITEEKSTGGRPRQNISLSIKGLEHLCLMADTQEGYEIREYFRACREKWEMVQRRSPQLAEEIEILHQQRQIEELKTQRTMVELQLLQKREYIATALPEPMQQKILGYQVVERVEYRDRTILPDGDRLEGVGITYIQKRFGFKTSKAAWAWLDSVGYGKDSGKWRPELTAVEAHKLDAALLDELDRLADGGTRQRWVGEG